ncbi:unnamed protein product [Vitrella brassicaformis CCMP3155]|uniref:NELL2-like EGF domain-containing protein n=1 Tax=Vitrella brassicaformis (strain CCMP3155) TaxID=1169540 RepID=A0A0G4FVK4_VITBC|nr:unnamed protein product [Vitrella brassicaformis CCMP3155]|eukprot:CEM18743.1 unnamed protein product [Vitrella brassicaformis CCMP3155]
MARKFNADGVDVDSFVLIEKNTVQLEARFLNEPLTGIQYYFLSKILHRYLPEFRGVWMAQHSARALESCGYTTANCADNTGYTLVDVQPECLVWQRMLAKADVCGSVRVVPLVLVGCGRVCAPDGLHKCGRPGLVSSAATDLANDPASATQNIGTQTNKQRQCNTGLCNVNNGGCHERATCSVSNGLVVSLCEPGYAGDGVVCENIDECATNTGGCPSLCVNYPGGFTCVCSHDNDTCTSTSSDGHLAPNRRLQMGDGSSGNDTTTTPPQNLEILVRAADLGGAAERV